MAEVLSSNIVSAIYNYPQNSDRQLS